MKKSFYDGLTKPIIGLSPMDGVTDAAMRFITKKYGNPDLTYTEFVSVEGLCHKASKLMQELRFDEIEKPVIAQVFGKTPDNFREVAVLLCDLGFDGIDINMGCPAKTVAQNGSGAALIRTPELAKEIIIATKQGVLDYKNGMNPRDCLSFSSKILEIASQQRKNKGDDREREIPVSVKTRIGYELSTVEEWIHQLLETEPTVITLHGRTLKQQYSGEANWEEIAKAVEIAKDSDTLIFGNGDVKNKTDAIVKANKYSVDGVLIGRAAFGNPFVFLDSELKVRNKEKLQIALEHAQLYEKLFTKEDGTCHFLPMRKHLGWYVKGFGNAKELRAKFYRANNSRDVAEVVGTRLELVTSRM